MTQRKPKLISPEALATAKPGVYKLRAPLEAFKAGRTVVHGEPVFIHLRIPKGAIVVSPRFNSELQPKYRTNRARVLGMWKAGRDGNPHPKAVKVARPWRWGSSRFRYREKSFVSPAEALNRDLNAQCAHGIHFFLEVLSALNFGCCPSTCVPKALRSKV